MQCLVPKSTFFRQKQNVIQAQGIKEINTQCFPQNIDAKFV